MTTRPGDRTGRRVLSWALAVVLVAVVGVLIYREQVAGPSAPAALVTVTGVIGSEKMPFFTDPRVQAAFRSHGLDVRVDPAGSWQIAETVRLDDYDFAFPSSAPAADRLLAVRPTPRTYTPFSSPMAVATFAPIVDLLTKAGVVTTGSQSFDVARYLDLAAKGTRWDQLPGNTTFPARKNILLSTTAPCSSNSGAMYLSIASYVADADTVVGDAGATGRVLPAMAPLFRDQGYLPSSSGVLFEDYLSAGIGKVPMGLVYEAQYLAEALSADPALTADARLLYPSPTIYSKHTLVPLKPVGDQVGELLSTDRDLVALEAQFGWRTADPRVFADAVRAKGLPAPPELVNVVEPPSSDVLQGLLKGLGCAS